MGWEEGRCEEGILAERKEERKYSLEGNGRRNDGRGGGKGGGGKRRKGEMGEKEQREGEGREPTSPNQVRVNILLLDIRKKHMLLDGKCT